MVQLTAVTDARSNPSDQIAHAARTIGRSADRKKVFDAIYWGKKKTKTAGEIASATKLPRIRVLQEAKKLAKNQIIHQTKFQGETSYQKDDFYDQNKRTILRLAGQRKRLEKFPTKISPRTSSSVQIKTQQLFWKAVHITIDRIDSFAKVRTVAPKSCRIAPLAEAHFKKGIQRILGERGEFPDWGGERNDLFTTRLTLLGERRRAAFAFKGRGTKGKLRPKHMGKHGDQIQRLFMTAAEVFLVQYWGQVDEAVLEQMRAFALEASAREKTKVYYGVIDGLDSARLLTAYSHHFRNVKRFAVHQSAVPVEGVEASKKA